MIRLLACLLLLLGLSACSGDERAEPAGRCGDTSAAVSDAGALQAALDAAGPGDTVVLRSGTTYAGSFEIRSPGTSDDPVTLCGPRGAVLDGGSIHHGYTLHLTNASYWRLKGFTVTGGQKGLMIDGSSHVVVDGLQVEAVGDEGIHLRAGSSDNVVRGTTVQRTGLREPRYGEGIYVGSAESNWCEVSDCEPDRSDRNRLVGNRVRETTAEAVDLKEGTSDGELRGNDLSGPVSGAADSVVDVKGNGWSVRDNRVHALAQDAAQVHVVVSQWGRDNRFVGNSFVLSVSGGFAVDVVGAARSAGNVVACGQRVRPAADGKLSNVDCR